MRFYKDIENLLIKINQGHAKIQELIKTQNILSNHPSIKSRLNKLDEIYARQLANTNFDTEKELFKKAFSLFKEVEGHENYDLYLCYYNGNEDKVSIQYLDRKNNLDYVDELDLHFDFSDKFLAGEKYDAIVQDDFYELMEHDVEEGWKDKFRLQYFIELKKMLLREFAPTLGSFSKDFSIYMAPYDDSEFVLVSNEDL